MKLSTQGGTVLMRIQIRKVRLIRAITLREALPSYKSSPCPVSQSKGRQPVKGLHAMPADTELFFTSPKKNKKQKNTLFSF